MSRYTTEDAERAGHVPDVMDVQGYATERYIADCSCKHWFSADYSDRTALMRAHTEHAAEAEGKCWSCSRPDDGANRDACYRCWVMWWSREREIVPRDIPVEWPGRQEVSA